MLFMDMEMSDIRVFIKFYLLWKLSTTLCDVLAIRNGIIFDYYPGPLHISFDTTINRKLDAGLNTMQQTSNFQILISRSTCYTLAAHYPHSQPTFNLEVWE